MPVSSAIWALLTLALALWAVPVDRVGPLCSPAWLTVLAAGAMAALYCALVASVLAG